MPAGRSKPGEIYETDIFAGLEWIIARHDQVDPPIKVVNISRGGNAGEDPLLDQQYHDLIIDLYNLGIAVVTSDEHLREAKLQVSGPFVSISWSAANEQQTALLETWKTGVWCILSAVLWDLGGQVIEGEFSSSLLPHFAWERTRPMDTRT